MLEALRLARVKHVAPTPHFIAPKAAADAQSLQAVITNRYDVLANYAVSLQRAYADEQAEARDPHAVQQLERWLKRDEKLLRDRDRASLSQLLTRSRVLQKMYSMRRDLVALWTRSAAPREQLVAQLQDWCRRAEASGIRPLAEFSQRLRSYA